MCARGLAAAPPEVETLPEVPVYLLFGGADFLVAGNSRKLVDRIVAPEDQAFGLEIVEPEGDTVADAVQACSQVLQGLQTLGFFGGGKTVWLRDAAFLGSARTMKSDETKAALDAHVETVPFLVRISAAKQLRDDVEQAARLAGEQRVTAADVLRARAVGGRGRAA